MTPRITDDPVQDAMTAFLTACHGMGETAASFKVRVPGASSPASEHAQFRAVVEATLREAVISLAMAAGEVGFHLRRQSAADALASNSTFVN